MRMSFIKSIKRKVLTVFAFVFVFVLVNIAWNLHEIDTVIISDSKFKISSLATVNNEVHDIVIAPIGLSYICSNKPNATTEPGGCVDVCTTKGRHGIVTLRCHVLDRQPLLKGEFKKADVVVNHFGKHIIRRRSNGPPYVTVFYTGESDRNIGRNTLKTFPMYDMVISFQQSKPFYFTYAHTYRDVFQDIMIRNIQDRGPRIDDIWIDWQARLPAVAVFVSSCNPMRKKVIQLFSGVYEVHSFGKCHHNKEVPQECQELKKYDQKICVFRKYKYALSMENTKQRDYVTEKVYHVLFGGAIPLYWGAPNIEEFVPGGRRSFIDMNKFLPTQLEGDVNESTEGNASYLLRVLSNHLQRLETDKAAVRSLIGWRFAQSAEEWTKEFWNNLHHTDPICGVCAEAYKRRSQISSTKDMET